MLLCHVAIFTLSQCFLHCLSSPQTFLDTNIEAAWSQLVGCWSGVVTFEGVPAILAAKSEDGYHHCCFGSIRMVETRFSFSTIDDVPVVDRYFGNRLEWRLDETVLLTLQGMINFGINKVRNLPTDALSRRQDGDSSSFSLEFRPFYDSNASAGNRVASVAFECQNLYVQDDGERLVLRSVVYYPTHDKGFTALYACPHFDGNPVEADTFPVPVRCPFMGSGLGTRSGCTTFKSESHPLGLHKMAVTFVEYELSRSHTDLCRDVNLFSSLGWNSDDSSSNKRLSVGALLAIVLVSVCVCLATLPLIRKYVCASRSNHLESKEAAGKLPHTIGALDSEDKTCEIQASSGVDFQGEMMQLFAIGHVEHWVVRPEDVTDLELVAGGGFGAVFRGMMHRSSEVAVKTIKETGGVHNSQLIALQHETRILRRIRHPNIVLFQGITVVQYEGSDYLALVLEWIPGGHMGSYLRKLHVTNWHGDLRGLEIRLMTDISRGLLYLHHQVPVIVHRDLKPENVLVEDVSPPRAKITDFGLSVLFTGEALRGRVGTRSYMAPEVFLRQSYGTSADMYSFGCIIWFVLIGKTPPKEDAKAAAIALRKKDIEQVSLVELCIACLADDPEARPQVSDAHALLTSGEATMPLCEASESDARLKPRQKL
eukprot:TRINITY_DN11382_c0_g5_i1.p1 TRINITY_DN11382_c0_g5~~TRINITY_DN11382_c0_g5_i1.p1  ORF type:complete len:653 (+),score=43.60 TRINITY_DN11382_c0_g5_i1:16-1974(+)